MAVFAANVTKETPALIDNMVKSDEFVKFKLRNKLNLHDNTVLIRLAIINLMKHLPSDEEVQKYKIALIRPGEFDEHLKESYPLEAKLQ